MPIDHRIALAGDRPEPFDAVQTMGDLMNLAVAKDKLQDYDRDRKDQAETDRIIAASGNDPKIVGGALRSRGFYKQAEAYEGAQRKKFMEEAGVLDTKLKKDAAMIETGARHARLALLNPSLENWTANKNVVAQLDPEFGPQIADMVFGTNYDPEKTPALLERALEVGETAAQYNMRRQQALIDAKEGRWEKALGGYLSTAQSDEEWQGIIKSMLDRGMPAAVAQMFDSHWTTEGKQRAWQMTMTPNERDDNLVNQQRADTDKLEAENRAAGRGNATGPAQGPNAAAVATAVNRINLWRANAERELARRAVTEHMKPEQVQAERTAIDARHKQMMDEAKVGAAVEPPPQRSGSMGDMMEGKVEGTLPGIKFGDVSMPSIKSGSPFGGSQTDAAPRAAQGTPATAATGEAPIPERPVGRQAPAGSDASTVAGAASGSPNSPGGGYVHETTGGTAPVRPTYPPSGVPRQWSGMDRGDGPSAAIGVERPDARQNTNPTREGSLPKPSERGQDVRLPREDKPQLNLSVPAQNRQARALAKEKIRAKGFAGTDAQIDAFLKSEKNRKLLNIIEK